MANMTHVGDEARSLVPLPTQAPDASWQETAEIIAQHFDARPATYPNPAGTRSHLQDPNIIAHLLAAVDDGLSPTQAVNAVGINPTTYMRWVKRAEEEPDSPHALFCAALKTAQDRRRRRLLSTIGKAADHAPQHWTAAAWLLERGYGNDYKLAVDRGTGGVTIQIGIKDSELTVNMGDSGSAPLTLDIPQT